MESFSTPVRRFKSLDTVDLDGTFCYREVYARIWEMEFKHHWVERDWAKCPRCNGRAEVYTADLRDDAADDDVAQYVDCGLPGTVYHKGRYGSLDSSDAYPHIYWRGRYAEHQ